eukprot:CAMPEP_0206015780 /NCGR_PEP_ID=MMETSP1464-20131121/21132_1 /ASSEMBLY_ACC=CAM_ASM_001124 /TAXON_ID=119497 /ORGANISM="Exanthemachrysis gayraliae, Strain RCC1523" /LENGTH=30 /DNA_ID= /DNA_START= /DNA_END= /DNA_ORIENTATION=
MEPQTLLWQLLSSTHVVIGSNLFTQWVTSQ